jgi:hypothetical protein
MHHHYQWALPPKRYRYRFVLKLYLDTGIGPLPELGNPELRLTFKDREPDITENISSPFVSEIRHKV